MRPREAKCLADMKCPGNGGADEKDNSDGDDDDKKDIYNGNDSSFLEAGMNITLITFGRQSPICLSIHSSINPSI